MLRLVFDFPVEGEDFWVDNVSVTQYMPAVRDAGVCMCVCVCGWVCLYVCVGICEGLRTYICTYIMVCEN